MLPTRQRHIQIKRFQQAYLEFIDETKEHSAELLPYRISIYMGVDATRKCDTREIHFFDPSDLEDIT